MVKYSIIVPVFNGMPYIKSCIESILCQNYDDYELIISDDSSTDGSREYIDSLNHPNVRLIFPDQSLSMTEHWDWALSHAIGSWQIFVGQDDGLQPYFFELADRLTEIAEKKKIRSIMSSRAYFFWPGCEPVYGDIAMSYSAQKKVKVLCSLTETAKALFGLQAYFELPEMYTTSLFHKSLLDEARTLQDGKVLVCHPQDANLGVLSSSLETKYLKSFIPLGWVGSSPKSAGMAISSDSKMFNKDDSETLSNLKTEYSHRIKNSSLVYNSLAGGFSFGDLSVYFWQCFLQTPNIRSVKLNRFFNSKLFKYVFFSSVQLRLWLSKRKKQSEFNEILSVNRMNAYFVRFLACIVLFFYPVYKGVNFIFRAARKVLRVIFRLQFTTHVKRSLSPKFSLTDASKTSKKLYDDFCGNNLT